MTEWSHPMEEIDLICASAQFRKAPAQRELLRYLWEHREEPVSEYAIGVDALGRKADFDPKTDATVRVQISRLRQRLKDYYEEEGVGRALRVQIPIGEYRLEVVEAPVAEVAAVILAPPSVDRWRWAALILLGVVGLIAADDLRLRWNAPKAPEKLHRFWMAVVREGRRVPIVVPAPVFFRWEKQPYVARDFGVNELGKFGDSPFLGPLAERFGPPQITQLYTVASDTVAASTLAQYLRDRGVSATVIDTPGATLEMLGGQDTIVFAGPGTTTQLGNLLDGMNFHVEPGQGGVLNRKPGAGEPEHFRSESLAPLRESNFGIIARLPGRTKGTSALVFLSSFNPALLSLAVTEAELEGLEAFRAQKGQGEHFEMVIRFERNADKVLHAKPVAYREFVR